MTTYIEAKGQNIELRDTDPANPTLGQIWYNTVSNELKGFRTSAPATWRTGDNMNTSRAFLAGDGIINSSLAIGGRFQGTAKNNVEAYDGTSWSNVTTLNTARYNLAAAADSSTAAVAFGGEGTPSQTAETELYNGTSWTVNPTGLSGTRHQMGSFGISTAAVSFGGAPSQTETWNGSTWTVNPTNVNTTPRDWVAGAGILTAGLAFGGQPITDSTEIWNGSTWTANPTGLNTARFALAGDGTSTSAVAFGGQVPGGVKSTATETWNGSTWTSGSNMIYGIDYLAGSGGSTSAIGFGGESPSGETNLTQVFLETDATAVFN